MAMFGAVEVFILGFSEGEGLSSCLSIRHKLEDKLSSDISLFF